MLAPLLLRVGSIVLHSVMGGMAVFCLIYAAIISDPEAVSYLCLEGGKWGVMGWLVLHFQCKYLDA